MIGFKWFLSISSIGSREILPLKEPGRLFVVSRLHGIRESVLAHDLRIEEVVHGSDLFKELFIVGKVEGREHSLEGAPSLILVLSLLQQQSFLLRELIDLLRLH